MKKGMGMKKRTNVLGLLLLLPLCASLLTACSFFTKEPSKRDVIAYVEETYGEKPRVVSVASSQESKGNHFTVYTLQINQDNPVEFTIRTSWSQGNYGPVSAMKDFHNHDVVVSKNHTAKALAGAYGIRLETEPDSYTSKITLYLNQESQLSEITHILLKLDDLYSFVYTDKGVKISVEIVLQLSENAKTAETMNFHDFRKIFNTDLIPITAIESLFKIQPKQIISPENSMIYDFWRREDLTQINRAIYDAWSEETGYTFEEIYPLPNPLRANPDYWECGDCNGRGGIGWGKKRVECQSCGGVGYTPNKKDIVSQTNVWKTISFWSC